MPVQAIPMALVAGIYPLGLAMVLLLATATRPRAKAGVFLTGAAACTLAVGFVVVFALHGAGFGASGGQSNRYGLRLGFGLILLTAAAVVAVRPARPKKKRSRASRWTGRARDGGLALVFLTGLAMYLPSPAYLSALERVGSSKLSVVALAGWTLLITVLVLVTIAVPILLFLLAPGWTIPRLQALDGWLARNARVLMVSALTVLGLWETIDALIGLWSLAGDGRQLCAR